MMFLLICNSTIEHWTWKISSCTQWKKNCISFRSRFIYNIWDRKKGRLVSYWCNHIHQQDDHREFYSIFTTIHTQEFDLLKSLIKIYGFWCCYCRVHFIHTHTLTNKPNEKKEPSEINYEIKKKTTKQTATLNVNEWLNECVCVFCVAGRKEKKNTHTHETKGQKEQCIYWVKTDFCIT